MEHMGRAIATIGLAAIVGAIAYFTKDSAASMITASVGLGFIWFSA